MEKDFAMMKDLFYVMTNRIERLEKQVDELVEEKRVASTSKFEDDKKSFRKDLVKLMSI